MTLMDAIDDKQIRDWAIEEARLWKLDDPNRLLYIVLHHLATLGPNEIGQWRNSHPVHESLPWVKDRIEAYRLSQEMMRAGTYTDESFTAELNRRRQTPPQSASR